MSRVPTLAPSGGPGTHSPHCTCRYEQDTVMVQDLGNIFTRLPLKRVWHQVCKGRASSQQGRGGTAGQGSQDPDLLCPPPRCCCVLGRRCAWTPPAPMPQPPPTTSTTLKCGRRSTSPSSCPAGTCASGFLWALVAREVAGLWASARSPGILCLGFLIEDTMGVRVVTVNCSKREVQGP